MNDVERMEKLMEFAVKRDVFLGGIQKTLGIVEKKTTMPILNNLLLKAEGQRIKIMATDREIGLVADYAVDVHREGEITLSARKLHEMVREIQGETILVSKGDRDIVTLACNRAVYRLPGIPADDYPLVVDPKDVTFYPIQSANLRELIRKTAFAISTDEMRRSLNGVFLETIPGPEGAVVSMVATDGHRLAMMKMAVTEKDVLVLDKGVIVPRKGLGEIRRLLEDEGGEVLLGIRQGVLILKTDHTLLRVSLIDGEYPDYRRVLPTEKGIELKVEKEKLLHALRRMSVISSERYNGVVITVSEGRIVLNSTNPDVGEANDEIDVSYQGEERSVGYNVTYLTDAIEVVDEESIELEIGEGMKPGVVRGAGNDDYLCIVMPLKL